MSAGTYNITLEQGALFYRTFTLVDRYNQALDLTDVVEARAMIRRHATQKEPTAVFTMAIASPETGKFTMSMDNQTTATVPAQPHKYDVEFEYSDGRVHRIIAGEVDVRPNITR